MKDLLLEIIFWISLVIISHVWIGYPLLLALLGKLKSFKKNQVDLLQKDYVPTISFVIPVHNAAETIVDKINNILESDYSEDKVEIIIISDGSKDETVVNAKSLNVPNLRIYELKENRGKSVAQNYGVDVANNDVLIFTDVESRLDREFVSKVVPYLGDPHISCVGGRAINLRRNGQIAYSHNIYSRIEEFTRKKESDLGMLHSLPGWGFAVRKSDYVKLDADTGDDMILPLELALRGKRSVVVPSAKVADYWPSSLEGEFRARQRITLRNLTGLMRRKALLNPLKFPRMAFAIWSHKLLRWMSPIFMLAILFSSMWLSLLRDNIIYESALYVQLAGYLAGICGLVASQKNMNIPLLGHVSSFLVANSGFLVGFMRFLVGQRIRSYKNV